MDKRAKFLEEPLLKVTSDQSNSIEEDSVIVCRKKSIPKGMSQSVIERPRSILKSYDPSRFASNVRGESVTNERDVRADFGKKGGAGRISFSENNMVRVHEVENWKKFNQKESDCCSKCIESCNVF